MGAGEPNELVVRVEPDAGSGLRVLAPAVGIWSDPPQAGELVGPGGRVGVLRQLKRRFVLRLPEGACGWVERADERRVLPVEHGQPVFRLAPLAGRNGAVAPALEAASRADLPAGCFALLAPTDGVFYRRPAPDAPPFLEVGDAIATGQPIGLIEVMKTFNQIIYGGAGLPEAAELVELRAGDSAEVSAGQILLVVRRKS